VNKNTDETAVQFPTTWGHALGVWENIGGGCGVGGDEHHPCGDTYENAETGERMTIFSTAQRHVDMPEFVDDLSELYSLDGVRPGWAEDSEAWKHRVVR
jgi:hypothetical protein